MSKRVCIFIDGSNFYYLVLKKLGVSEPNFNFDAFAAFLADDREIVSKGRRYYVGTTREREGDPKSRQAMSRQTRLFSMLKTSNWQIKTSKLRRRVEEIVIDRRALEYKKLRKAGIKKITVERMREKGIDVKIATDLMSGAVEDKYDIAILISSDSDLIPAIDWVRRKTNKKIEYIGFSIADRESSIKATKPTHSLIRRTDTHRILGGFEMGQFIRNNPL